jgi:hypothetical protein
VKGNWQEDETLKKVMDEAVKGISQFLTSTVPDQLTGGELALKEVLSFEKQVNSFNFENTSHFLNIYPLDFSY